MVKKQYILPSLSLPQNMNKIHLFFVCFGDGKKKNYNYPTPKTCKVLKSF